MADRAHGPGQAPGQAVTEYHLEQMGSDFTTQTRKLSV